jgi:hypothetical protein
MLYMPENWSFKNSNDYEVTFYIILSLLLYQVQTHSIEHILVLC